MSAETTPGHRPNTLSACFQQRVSYNYLRLIIAKILLIKIELGLDLDLICGILNIRFRKMIKMEGYRQWIMSLQVFGSGESKRSYEISNIEEEDI